MCRSARISSPCRSRTRTTGWAVGHDGVVLHSGDAGRTWNLQLDGRRIGELMVDYYSRPDAAPAEATPALREQARRFAAQGADNPLLDVWFRDASNGYVVGAFGLALRTRDGGKTWQPLLQAIDNPKGLHLYAVRGIGSDVYIVGEQGTAFKLERDAERFTTLELPYKGTLFGVVGNERAVVVHGLRGNVLRSTDGGRSWQSVTTGLQVGMTASALDARGPHRAREPGGPCPRQQRRRRELHRGARRTARARRRGGRSRTGRTRRRRTARRPTPGNALSGHHRERHARPRSCTTTCRLSARSTISTRSPARASNGSCSTTGAWCSSSALF